MKRHALFVGVDQYADGHIPNLTCAVSDATDLHGFFKYGAGYDQVELLPNPSSKKEVLGKVRNLTAGLGPGDFFLFFFAGHGFRVGENHVLVCSNDLYDDVKYEYDGLPLGQLKHRLSGAFNSALLLDACQSDILATRGGEGIAERDLSLIHEAPTGSPGGGALTIVTSCDAGQTAAELSERRHGLFTVAMLDLLREAQRTHVRLDLSDAFRLSLGQRMGEIAARFGLPTEQRPRFSCTGDSCFVLLDGVAPMPSAPQPPPQSQQPAAPVLVTCPVCLGNVQPVGTHNCVKCGKKYVCADCWDKEYKRCTECAGKMREADRLLAEGKRFKERKAYQEAAECFRKAAALENREACHHYGDALFNGHGVEKDVEAALTYYQKCDASDAWIQYDIGQCHLHFAKERGDAKEGKEAVAWLQKSADRGVPWACVMLGDCYRDGIGLPRPDFAKAAKCYRRALEDKGLKTFGDYGAAQWAEFNMGCLCRNGQGVEKNLVSALQWFRKAMARKDEAADLASTAAAEVLPDVLVEREGDKLGKYWQDFRIIHGVQIRDAVGQLVPLAGLVASNRAIFVGVSLESLPSNIRNSIPDDNHNLPDNNHNPAWPFAKSISQHCGIPEKCFLATLVVPDTFRGPDTKLPPWAVRESDLVDAMLNSKAEEAPDWLGKRQDIIRELEKLPMSSEGAEKNALIHFKADIPEWEDGAELLEKIEKPSHELIQLAQQAEDELEQAGKRSVADNVRKWLEKKGAAKARPVTSPKTGDAKKLVQPGEVEGEHKKIQLWDGGPYWAGTNLGAQQPWEFGCYFWWGDTVGYKFEDGNWVASDGSSTGFSFEKRKTVPTLGNGISALRKKRWITAVDTLAPEHDAAQVQWGGGWRMPTEQELRDLSDKCDWTWKDTNGVGGYVIRGRGAYASASIFLPCAGYGDGPSLRDAGSRGYYWSSVPYSDYASWFLYFDPSHREAYDLNARYSGQSIRPVQDFAK